MAEHFLTLAQLLADIVIYLYSNIVIRKFPCQSHFAKGYLRFENFQFLIIDELIMYM